MNKNIWMCGVPGSRWSGVDIQLRESLPTDRTDEIPERTFYHRVNIPGDKNNGHRGSYWGPGMGCGEDWVDFNKLTAARVQSDIDSVFNGEGLRVIKGHVFARGHNLDWIYHNMPGDYIFLIYREPQSCFAWWSEVMDFGDDHYPNYTKAYTDYNKMREHIWLESAKIVDFAIKHDAPFKQYDPAEAYKKMPGYTKKQFDMSVKNRHTSVYYTWIKIPG